MTKFRAAVLAFVVTASLSLAAQQLTPFGDLPGVSVPASAVNGGGVVTVPLLFPDGTSAAPSIAFAAQTNTGLYREGNASITMSLAGSRQFTWTGTSYRNGADSILSWTASNGNGTAAADSGISRTGVAALAVGNGTQGDFTGTLKLNTLNGTIIQFGGVQYLSVGGSSDLVVAGAQLHSNANGVASLGTGSAAWLDTYTTLVRLGASGGNGVLGATANKLIQINDGANATGLELNAGTPTLGTCTGGAMTSGSHNISGEVTGNTSGSCVINFGTPNFTNTPFCFANDETTLTAVRISARSTSSITVTGAVSGDAFQFFCLGRIGT